MKIPQPRTALWRATSFLLILSAAAALGLWWSENDEDVPPAPGPAPGESSSYLPDGAGDGPAPPPPPVLREGELSAPEVARHYQADRHAANARYQGQRLTVRGQVLQIERAQDGALLITFHAEDDAQPLRALLQETGQPEPQVGEALGLDCLNQGLVMEEPLLIDCRIPS